jgi:hypothetical protein
VLAFICFSACAAIHLFLAFYYFGNTYSAVARSLILCKPNTCCILDDSFFAEHLIPDKEKDSIMIRAEIRIMQFTKRQLVAVPNIGFTQMPAGVFS